MFQIYINGKDKCRSSNAQPPYYRHYLEWRENPYLDEDTRKELAEINGDDDEISSRFSGELEFGTGGMRGVLGAGPNRMNCYVVRRATQGLSGFLLERYRQLDEKKVAVAYDSRHCSREFAEESALVLAANGIRALLFDDIRPTPVLSFAIRELGCMAGIVITASHNPARYNGYKVYLADGGQAVPSETEKITAEIKRINLFGGVNRVTREKAMQDNLLTVIGENVDRRYLDEVKSLCTFDGNKDLKVVYTPLHGAGYRLIPRILEELGYRHVYPVEDQMNPDPDFSTVASPNPEEGESFSMAMELARQKQAHIILATDPDCDRVGCAVRDSTGGYPLLNGNQVGVLLLNYLLGRLAEKGEIPANGVMIKTIVTGNLGRKIASEYGLETVETLTGFKYIGEKIREFEEEGNRQFVFGYEESYGYLAGTFSRDKDGVVASALLVEAAAFYLEKGLTLPEVLESLYRKYGYHLEELNSQDLKDPRAVQRLLKELQNRPITEIGGLKVTAKKDFLKGRAFDLLTGEETAIDLPRTEALFFQLEGEAWICIRPSGTEPKLKLYFSAAGRSPAETREAMEALKRGAAALLDSLS